MISFGHNDERVRAPLRELILLRMTSGIYYDLIRGGSHLLNEASDRFERYSAEYIAALMPRFEVSRASEYTLRGNTVHTPDLRIKEGGQVLVALECKATKLTFAAQFGEDPLAEARRGYEEIAKGVFQLWRYFSHTRRGLIRHEVVRDNAHGIVLTLDTWLVMSRQRQEQVLAMAEAFARDDNEIVPVDRRKVIFCAIQDLESTLAAGDEASFLSALSAAVEDRFTGWLLPIVHRETQGEKRERKKFPFDLGKVLPWWDKAIAVGKDLGQAERA